jgi:hypothetical protein
MTETSPYSHPDQSVRHSYPLAVKEEGFGPACDLCLKTVQYILLRLCLLVGLTLAAIIWLVICGSIASLFSGKDSSGGGGLFLFLVGFAAPVGAFVWIRKYMLYLLKAGHVAVLTKLITEGQLPEDKSQVQYGKEIVTEKFAQTNIMFALDSLIEGVVRAFNNTLNWLADLLPVPGLESLMQLVNRVVQNATTYIDETVLSYNLARDDENPWRSSVDAVVYYAQNVKPVLKTAVWSLVLEYIASFIVFILCLLPAAVIAQIMPDSVSGWAWIFAVILAWNIRDAVLHPVFLTMVLLTFHKHVHEQPINEEYAAVLSSASDKFQELVEKAKQFVAPTSAAAPPAGA